MAQKTRFFVSDVQPSILMSQAENKRAFDTMGNYFANRDLTDTFREENGWAAYSVVTDGNEIISVDAA